MGKVIKYKDLSKEINHVKRRSKKIVLAGGCFDIIHAGHIEFLTRSRRLGDSLVILLESDATVKRLKGNERPINSQKDRALILSTLSPVDYVIMLPVLHTDKAYANLVKLVEPGIIAVTAPDPIIHIKKKYAKDTKAKLVAVMKRKKGYSTYDLIKRVSQKI